MSTATLERTESRVGQVWIPQIVQHISLFLPMNYIACTLRLVDKATSAQFGETNRVIKLSLPCPEHAFQAKWGVAGALRPFSYIQRRQLLKLTAASGSIPNLNVALRAIANALTDEPFQSDAAALGQLCLWLEDHGFWWMHEVFTAAAGAGQQQVCEWLLACGCPSNKTAVYAAARGAHLGLMEWLLLKLPHLRGQVTVDELLEALAEGCQLEDLQQQYIGWTQEGQQLSAEGKVAILVAAAGSPTPDWRAKVEWLEGLPGYPRNYITPGCRGGAAGGVRVDADLRLR